MGGISRRIGVFEISKKSGYGDAGETEWSRNPPNRGS